MNVVFDYFSVRAKKARLARKMLQKSTQLMLYLIILASGAVGLMVIALAGKGGAVLLIPAVIVGVFQIWLHSDDVQGSPGKLPPTDDTLKLHEVLDRRVLGRLKRSHTPQDIWHAVRGTWRQRFFTVRYGIPPELFDNYLSSKVEDSQVVWQHALELAHHEGQNSITGATLTVALLTTIPGYETYLAQLHLEPVDLVVGIDWQRHVELLGERAKQKSNFGGIARDWSAGYTPLLNRMGHNISYDIQYQGGLLNREIDAHKAIIDNMLHILGQQSRANVMLVGHVGVGKTTMVYNVAQRLISGDKTVPPRLRYDHIVTLQAPTILAQANANTGLNVENVVIQLIAEARAAQNIVLFFDEAQYFFNQGTGSVDLRNVLMPILEGGTVPIIMAMGPSEWQLLSTQNPALASLMNYQAVGELDEQNTMRVLEDQVLFSEYKHRVVFTYQSLLEAYRLASRYIHDIAFPGRGIRVLEGAITHAEGGVITEASIQKSLEVTLGVKIQTADPMEKQKLLNLEDEIHRRMINQKRAVAVVSDALRRARSGVNNPNKPIGTFLFMGPTGVGKTELSKALAEVYFSGADRIVRIDMNEFVRSEDVARLLAPVGENSTGLLSAIRRQPFTVVLFDEIEKAHPDVVNVLLQLLDEGVMRDTNNKEVSFKDAIIIATSNAGADAIRQQIDAGRNLEDFEEQFIEALVNSGIFKPEFLNRFDEIVLFRPLSKEELLQVVDLLIATVNKTLARQKVQIQLTDPAKKWLVEHGYDARLGARPLRRMVQRSVENIVAKKLLEDNFAPGSMLTLDEPDLEAILSKDPIPSTDAEA